MRQKLLISAISGIWAISPDHAQSHFPIIANILQGKPSALSREEIRKEKLESTFRFAHIDANAGYVISDYGYSNSPESAPVDSVAVLNINGPITTYDQYCGSSGCLTKADLLTRADNNPNIKAIVLVIDSGGGEAYAALEFSRHIKTINKPIVAYVRNTCGSAAYWIASATGAIVANNEFAILGSIGTFQTLVSLRKHYESMGIQIVDVYADKSVDKNKIYMDALSGNTAALKEKISQFNNEFLKSVKENRKDFGLAEDSVWNTGKEFYASQAMEHGLCDDIDTLENTIQSLLK